MTDREAIVQALTVLKAWDALIKYQYGGSSEAMTAMQNVAWRTLDTIEGLEAALAQPEQEPVAWITPDGEGFRMRLEPPTDDVPLGWKALYTAPPKQWVGLHWDDMPETYAGDKSFLNGAVWAEAKLKEKNGG